jgi:hypothetical protein
MRFERKEIKTFSSNKQNLEIIIAVKKYNI